MVYTNFMTPDNVHIIIIYRCCIKLKMLIKQFQSKTIYIQNKHVYTIKIN